MTPSEDTTPIWVPPVEALRPDGSPLFMDPYFEDPYNPDPYAKM
ncbi:MAG TPA: hypothetical protein VK188_02645 [Holophaga sp.]|nr:hypothetical protein [Holophaga sp.]